MFNDTFTLGLGQAQQLEFAFNRNGWGRADVHALCQGDVLGYVKRFMEQPDNPPPELKGLLKNASSFSPWKTIVIGELKTMEELIAALKKEDYEITNEAESILLRSAGEYVPGPTEVDLVLIDVSDLGLPDEASPTTVFRILKRKGLQLCTPQIAAEARRNFDEQDSKDDQVFIAMDLFWVTVGDVRDAQILDLYFDEEDGELAIYADYLSEARIQKSKKYLCVLPRG